MGSFQNITAIDDFVFPAYVAQPASVPLGAVVVLQEIFGVNSHIQALTEAYAAQGYLAVAPSTFHRVQAGVNLGYTVDDINVGKDLKAAAEAIQPQVMLDVQAAVDFAVKQLPAGKKVGVVGYCWGGLLTWRAASLTQGISAAVPYYGAGMTVGAELARQPHCPVMVHFGEQDASIPLDTVHAFAAAQPKVDVQIYPANHGFNCDHRGAYNAPAATLALERTLAFFAQHLA
ncbi:MAG: dienelactone hydrolase family protein [Burkholderiaceae bacterium]|nr:dienelactone hydrolase family protein [Burkholderiaceae bacterium]